MKFSETSCPVISRIRRSKLAASWDRQDIIVLVVGFNQISGFLRTQNHTRSVLVIWLNPVDVRVRANIEYGMEYGVLVLILK